MEKIRIKETIVVEGKDDISAVKKIIDANIIQVNGHAIKHKDKIFKLKKAYETTGLIILTDPDYAGESIRKYINQFFPNSKNAYISRSAGTKNSDVGVENANEETILNAILKAKSEIKTKEEEIFTQEDMFQYSLMGKSNSLKLRQDLGDILGIGYANAKQFLNKLNKYRITREEFLNAINKIQK